MQLRVNGPKPSYNSIILKGKKLKNKPLTMQGSLGRETCRETCQKVGA